MNGYSPPSVAIFCLRQEEAAVLPGKWSHRETVPVKKSERCFELDWVINVQSVVNDLSEDVVNKQSNLACEDYGWHPFPRTGSWYQWNSVVEKGWIATSLGVYVSKDSINCPQYSRCCTRHILL